jgi:oxalate decarboxylase
MFSRRELLTLSAGAAAMVSSGAKAATFGNPDEPAQGAVNARSSGSLADPGPQSSALAKQFPDQQSPPATDVGGLPLNWASFNNASRRIQNGGWARQVTTDDFAISKEIAGVNMRLSPGGIRELHWHQAAEWAIMTYGTCRITLLDTQGRPSVADVRAGDLWYFPPGAPHSLQGLGPDGCEFVICFDDGHSSEFNTLLVTDWFAHTPPDAGQEFRRSGGDLRKYSAAQSVDIPGLHSRRSRRGPCSHRKERPDATLSFCLSPRQFGAS